VPIRPGEPHRKTGESRDADRPPRRRTLLTSRDIATLNRARAVLKRIEQTAWRRSLSHYDPFAPVTAWDLGRVSEAASAADDAIFHVLATARANCHVRMTDAQLFGPDPAREDVRMALAADAAGSVEEHADGTAPEEEPAAVETEPAVEAEPPEQQQNVTTDVTKPRRPIHAV
jgi:hypothetical protein